MHRFAIILLIALGLTPGLVWRDKPPVPDTSQSIRAVAIPLPGGKAAQLGGANGPQLVAAWRITSANDDFGSYSALVPLDGNTLLGFGDSGQMIQFALPPTANGRAKIRPVIASPNAPKTAQDIESATRDPLSGHIWLGYEWRNAIVRFEPDLSHPRGVQPKAMRGWRANGGPEAMVRLRDGRFIVLAEEGSGLRDDRREGLIFPGDPVDDPVDGGLETAEPQTFTIIMPPGFSPTDMAQLPDGRVVILLRAVKFGVPPYFAAKLLLADPAKIRTGATWPWEDIASIAPPLPADNMEGLAVTGGEDGAPVNLWLISDDNNADMIQQTLLLKLEWAIGMNAAPIRKKAREQAARSSE